jgi:hypothetical protein
MTYGPIDFLALEFPTSEVSGEVLAEVAKLVENETIRIIDLVIVRKDAQGKVESAELQELDPQTIKIFDPLHVTVTSMLTTEDIALIGDQLSSNSAAGLMLYENLWAIGFKQAVMNKKGRVLMQERIPHELVVQALGEVAVLASSKVD